MSVLNIDCLLGLQMLGDSTVDAVVTDPPYGISFMGKKWDYDVPSVEVWRECLRVLKPGGHLLAFAGTRTQHRMAVNIEDAGFEVRDLIAWAYGTGFPKSLDVGKAIDKMDGSEAQRSNQLRFTEWMRGQGLTSGQINTVTGTNMGGHYLTAGDQPAVATREHFEKLRPYFRESVPEWVENLIDNRSAESENFKRREVVGVRHGSRLAIAPGQENDRSAVGLAITAPHTEEARKWAGWGTALKPALEPITVARKPLVGSVAENILTHGVGAINIDGSRIGERWPANLIHDGGEFLGDAARFFYCAKASAADREEGNTHPTVKPTELMRYLCRLVTPPGGIVCDPFAGSGSTGKAAVKEGFQFLGFERDPEYAAIANDRITKAKQ